MFRRRLALLPCSLLLCVLGLALAATSGQAAPNFVYLAGLKDPAGFQNKFQKCITQFNAAGGLAGSILKQLDGAEVVFYYRKGTAAAVDPNPGGNTAGQLLYLHWDPNINGVYEDDGAPKIPCAVLLHELQHAARYFTGKECNGPAIDANERALFYDEQMGSRAENWWLNRLGETQRKTYEFLGQPKALGRWTRWPASSDHPVPDAPPCDRCSDRNVNVASNAPLAAACRRCTMFHQAGCVDFSGGVYSGGDHRRVATGSLEIRLGPGAYCQGREECKFENQYIAPHLDTAFPKGTEVTAIATPGKDSRFARWGPGVCKGQGPVCTFIARKPSCISARFLLTNPTAPPQSLPDVPCPEDP